MKKLIKIMLIILFIQPTAFSMDRDKLNKLKSKAKTNVASWAIEDYCAGEEAMFQISYGWACKCAIKAGKANNRSAANDILSDCGL